MDTDNSQNLTENDAVESDDVEAHGLKEVAIGLGAAALIGGGGAGIALASAGGTAGGAPGVIGPSHVAHQVTAGVDDSIRRHTPQGPPASTTDFRTLPTKPVKVPQHHVVPVVAGPNVGVPVGKKTEQAVQSGKQTVKAADELVQHMTTPVNAPPAQR
jgi:hypothetical protein